jgi:hypothetical protein
MLYRDPDSVLQRWLARGLDHWRFKVPDSKGFEAATPLRASAMPQPAIPLEQVFLCRERTSARGGETGRAPQKAPACRWRLRDFRLDGILFILRKS